MSRLQRRVENASPGALASLQAEVVAMVAATQVSAQQAQSTAGIARSADAALQSATTTARAAVTDFTRDFYEQKIFEPYLRFSSTEDEEAYRKREAERREAIDKAMAVGTPQATLEANRLAIEQLHDAGAHGADKSPSYAPIAQGLETSRDKLRAALPQSNRTAAKVDERLEADGVPSDFDEAKSKIDPAVLAVFAGSIASANSAPEGPGVGFKISSSKDLLPPLG